MLGVKALPSSRGAETNYWDVSGFETRLASSRLPYYISCRPLLLDVAPDLRLLEEPSSLGYVSVQEKARDNKTVKNKYIYEPE